MDAFALPPLRTFVTTKVVKARPSFKEGRAGYEVIHPDGHVSWCPKQEFDRVSRPLNENEVNLVCPEED